MINVEKEKTGTTEISAIKLVLMLIFYSQHIFLIRFVSLSLRCRLLLFLFIKRRPLDKQLLTFQSRLPKNLALF
jgi:hypothetical protein